LAGHVFAVQGIGELNQDTRAVAHQFVGTDRTPMVKVFQDLQGLTHHGVALHAFDVRHKPHPASIVLLAWVIQTRLVLKRWWIETVHDALPKRRMLVKLGASPSGLTPKRKTSIIVCNNNAKLFIWGQSVIYYTASPFEMNWGQNK
jgi:hypothetical protein